MIRSARMPRTIRLGLGLGLAVLGIGTRAAPPPEEPRHSPNGRLERARLEAVQASVDALAARRRNLLPRADGLLDLRSVFHAHAGDSSHTGGKPEEMLAAAKLAGVSVVFLSDHFRPPRDYMDSWRGQREGVLFIPAHMAEYVIGMAEFIAVRDRFSKDMLNSGRYNAGQIDNEWTAEIRSAFLDWIRKHPEEPQISAEQLERYLSKRTW